MKKEITGCNTLFRSFSFFFFKFNFNNKRKRKNETNLSCKKFLTLFWFGFIPWLQTHPLLQQCKLGRPPTNTSPAPSSILSIHLSHVERNRPSDKECEAIRWLTVQALHCSLWPTSDWYFRVPNKTCLVSFHSCFWHCWLRSSWLWCPWARLQALLCFYLCINSRPFLVFCNFVPCMSCALCVGFCRARDFMGCFHFTYRYTHGFSCFF